MRIAIAEEDMPNLRQVEPDIEDPTLLYDHEKWDPVYKEINYLRKIRLGK